MIKSDSRRVRSGDIFIALKGIKSDGHDYINDAISRGASRVIVEHGNYSVDTLVVPDTRDYLKKYLVSNYSSIFDSMTIIGITGTNGKTTTSYLIYQSLNKLGVKCSMIGTLGYYKDSKVSDLYNTCPDICMMYELLIDSYNSGYKCVVLEASSQGLAEDRLFGVKFDYSIFTNLTHDHLDYHKSVENYVMSKRKLFLQLKDSGIGIVNSDDPYSKYFVSNNLVKYGFNNCDYKVVNYTDFSFEFFDGSIHDVKHNLVGKYNIYNLMACIIVLIKMGFSYDSIISVIKSISSPDGRMEVYNYLDNRIIVDYAHTPDAISNVLSSLHGYNKLYAVFGCTGNRDRYKRPIMTKLLVDNCDRVIITSDDLYDESFDSIVNDMLKGINSHNYSICFDRGAAIKMGISLLSSNDILLVLGKGHESVIKIGSKRIPFNDGDFIKNVIKNV
ncbi:MAG: UDP-N-acetylmuramoyl-L-alanyl-D-glutamate--2,6-diaminopimelate ligase [Bacilli bacterium]